MNTVIAKRIKEIRMGNQLSQSQFGALLSVSQDTVSLWEKGKSIPTAECLSTICKTFHVSADYLLGLTDF